MVSCEKSCLTEMVAVIGLVGCAGSAAGVKTSVVGLTWSCASLTTAVDKAFVVVL